MKFLKTLSTICLGLIIVAAFIRLAWTFSSISPFIQDYLVRNNTNDSVLMIDTVLNNRARASATGFQMENSKKDLYVVTNRHVCDGIKEIYESNNGIVRVPSKVIKVSKKYDLCILSPYPYAGIPLNFVPSEPYFGQVIYVIGHPLGMPLTVTQGTLVGVEEDVIPVMLKGPNWGKDCTKYKGNIILAHTRPYDLDSNGCELPAVDYLISAPTRAGNSGSPVVTLDGEVLGIVSMRDEASWGLAVPWYQIKEFIEPEGE